jgi:hypothetical protein
MYTVRWYDIADGYHYAVCCTHKSAVRIAKALNFEIHNVKIYFDGQEVEW